MHTALNILSGLLDLHWFPDEERHTLPSGSALVHKWPEDGAGRGQCGVAKEAPAPESPGQDLNLNSGSCDWWDGLRQVT